MRRQKIYNFFDNLDRKQYVILFDGDKLYAKVRLSWKKSFSYGIVIPHKMRDWKKCSENVSCDDCDKLKNQNREISANLNQKKDKLLMKVATCFLGTKRFEHDNFVFWLLYHELYLQPVQKSTLSQFAVMKVNH